MSLPAHTEQKHLVSRLHVRRLRQSAMRFFRLRAWRYRRCRCDLICYLKSLQRRGCSDIEKRWKTMYDMKALHEAKSVADAVRLLQEYPQAQIIAGGSDVLIQMREGKRAGAELVSIYGLD